MVNAKQKAIIKKDLRGIIFNKRLFPTLIIVPIVFTVVFPTIFILASYFAPQELSEFQQLLDLLPLQGQSGDASQLFVGLLFNYIMPIFFIIIPIMAASVMAASSFVGEKEKSTLETLLYSPLTLKQIFQSKVLASFILSMIVSVGSFAIMLLVVEIEMLATNGSLIVPSVNWLIIMLLVAPAVSLISITMIVRGSAKSQTMEESQQKAVFLIFPVLVLIVVQFTGVFLVNAGLLLALGAVFALIAGLLMKGSMRKFDYETLLT